MGVVGDDGPVADEVHEHLHGFLLLGGPGHIAVPDAGELGDVRGNVPLRVHKGVEHLFDLPAGEDHRADLGHAVGLGIEAGGLNVKGHKLRVQGQLALAHDGAVAVHVVDEVALQPVDDLHAVLLPRLPHIREGLGHPMVSDGDGGHAPIGRPLDDGGRVGEGVQGGKTGVHMQLHPLHWGLVGPDIALALHDVPGVQHHVVVILGVDDLPLDDEMVPHVDAVNDALVLLRAEEAGDAHGVGAVGNVKAQHRAAPLLQAAAGDRHHVALHRHLAGFQGEGAHGHRALLDGPAHQHVPLGGAAGLEAGVRRCGRGQLGPGIFRYQTYAAETVVVFQPVADGSDVHRGGHGSKPGADGHQPLRLVDLHIGDIALVQPPGAAADGLAAGEDGEKGSVFAHACSPSLSISSTSRSQSSA